MRQTKFDQLVQQQMVATGCDQQEAVKRVARMRPDLHEEYLLATNPKSVHHLIRDRFEQAGH
jgi:hypothetical protein